MSTRQTKKINLGNKIKKKKKTCTIFSFPFQPSVFFPLFGEEFLPFLQKSKKNPEMKQLNEKKNAVIQPSCPLRDFSILEKR